MAITGEELENLKKGLDKNLEIMIETNDIFLEKLEDSEFVHEYLARFFEVPFSRYCLKREISNSLHKLS